MSTSQNPPDSDPTPPSLYPDDIVKVFKRFDSNGDGKISFSELGDVLSALGSSPSPDDLRRMMSELDSDGDGFIDLKEFSDFHCGSKGTDGQDEGVEDLKEAFEMYDLDKNGLISAAELHLVLKKLGEKCSVQDCSRMISSVDSDGDGSVNFEEFRKMMRNKISE